ncbi:RidA family protein [Hyphococcus sp.]|uniref:RidA family protein n=1 Tax=Hyphococcus sp. TaxID=2038636 RepID=UPI003CCC30E0
MRRVLQPKGWPRPKGYANGVSAEGRMVFTAGVVGWNAKEEFVEETLAGQFRQALSNIKAILKEGGARPEHIVRMTCYVSSCTEYSSSLTEIGAAWRDIFGKVFPCMSVIEVSRFVEPKAKIEIETTAVVPHE